MSYRAARQHMLAELIPENRFLGSLKVLKFGLRRIKVEKRESCQGQRTAVIGYQKNVPIIIIWLCVCESADEAKMGGGMLRWELGV